LLLDSVTHSKDKHREIPTDKGRGRDRMGAGILQLPMIYNYL